MARPPENRPPFSDPDQTGRSEFYAGSPDDLAPSEALHQQLAHWDELNEQDLARLQADPNARAKLQRLRQAEMWLQESLLDSQQCPSSEELFALGMPFAGDPLEAARRAEIKEHLEICADCAEDMQTLDARPPSPLLLDEPASFEGTAPTVPAPLKAPISLRGMRAFLSCAAALMLIWLLGGRDLWPHSGTLAAADVQWPNTSTMRGDSSAVLLTPFGKQLARGPAGTWSGELRWTPENDAQSYRIVLNQNDGSAFDLGTERLNVNPVDPALVLTSALSPGFYTVEIFATVFGLEAPWARPTSRWFPHPMS